MTGDPQVQIRLFGPFEATLNGVPISFMAERVCALLSYICVQSERAHHREELADLLWGDMDPQKARTNLRVTLSRLKKSLTPFQDMLPPDLLFLEVERKKVQLHILPQYVSVDLCEFDALIQQTQHPSKELPIEPLEQLVSLYKGDFLKGMYIEDAPDFEEWLVLEREKRHTQTVFALEQLLQHYKSQELWSKAHQHARKLLTLEPWRESSYVDLMLILCGMGQIDSALSQFEICKQQLQKEFGVEPSNATLTLYEELLEAKEAQATHALPPLAPLPTQTEDTPPPNNIPAPRLPYFGREEEQAQLTTLLLTPEIRLVTLVGMGGIGKTELSLQLARQLLTSFSDGCWFVSLRGLQPNDPRLEDRILERIQQELRFDDTGSLPPKTQIAQRLAQKNTLLILDNFEGLVDASDFILDFLDAAPRLTILATSRERFRFQSEYVFELEQLPLPGKKDTAVENFSSVRLFVERFQRHPKNKAPLTSQLPHIVEICRHVKGVPLAIELAASWGFKLSPAEIALRLKQSSSILKTRMRDIPGHHRSIRIVFEDSWDLLDPDAQIALARLSFFPESFTQEAASTIFQISPDILQDLVDKSLLQQNKSQISQHSLLQEYALEKRALLLSQEAQHQDLLKFSEFYLRGLNHPNTTPTDGHDRLSLDQLRNNIPNVSLAWTEALKREAWQLLEDSLLGLTSLFFCFSQFREAEHLLRETVNSIDASTTHPKKERPRALFRIEYSRILRFLTRLDQAHQLLIEAQPYLNSIPHELWHILTLSYLGDIYHRQGNFPQAKTSFLTAEKYARELNEDEALGYALCGLGSVLEEQGYFEEAQRKLEEALTLNLKLQSNPWQIGINLNNLGSVAWRRKLYDQAREHYSKALQIYEQVGSDFGRKMALANLGLIAQELGQFENAMSYYEASLSLSKELGDVWGFGMTTGNIGAVLLKVGQLDLASQKLNEALKISQEIGDQQGEAWVQCQLACLSLWQNKLTQARASIEASTTISSEIQDRNNLSSALLLKGRILSGLGLSKEADLALQQTIQLAEEMKLPYRHLEALAATHELLSNNNAASACTNILLEKFDSTQIMGMDDPFWFLQIYQKALSSSHSQQAHDLAQQITQQLLEKADTIQHPAWRESFLSQIPSHRSLLSK